LLVEKHPEPGETVGGVGVVRAKRPLASGSSPRMPGPP
jgi:hypothetical protein